MQKQKKLGFYRNSDFKNWYQCGANDEQMVDNTLLTRFCWLINTEGQTQCCSWDSSN